MQPGLTQSALSRRQREQRRHRQEILTAAQQVFTERGFHGSTMQDISTSSGFAVASLYKHFTSKEEIYHALVEQAVGQYLEILQNALENLNSPLERIKAALRATVTVIREQSEISQFVLAELRGLSDAQSSTWRGQTARDMYFSVLVFYEVLIEEAQSRGEIAAHMKPLDVALVILGALLVNLLYWAHFGGADWTFDPEGILRVILDRVALA